MVNWDSEEERKWWAEQAARRPKRYQVWRLSDNGIASLRMLTSTDDVEEACKTARGDRPAMVLDLETLVDKLPGEVLRCTRKNERGPLAYGVPPAGFVMWLADAKKLALARDGDSLVKLGLGTDRARPMAEQLRNGELKWGKRHMVVDAEDVTIEVRGNRAHVRRGEPR